MSVGLEWKWYISLADTHELYTVLIQRKRSVHAVSIRAQVGKSAPFLRRGCWVGGAYSGMDIGPLNRKGELSIIDDSQAY